MSGAALYEQRLHDTAVAQEHTNRLAEAATSWEILTVLKPESVEYRDHLRDVRRLADVALADKFTRAEAAQKKGDFDTATTQYLGALALDPSNSRAADALRAVERERNRRTVLGKASRLLLTKRSIANSQAIAPSVNVPLDSNELEVATMLGKQGDFDDAIGLLEARLAIDKGDSNARGLLADLYAQKAEKRLPRDRVGAISAFEKSVRLDPSNAPVVARLKQLKGSAVSVAKPTAVARAVSAAPSPAGSAAARIGRPAPGASAPMRTAFGVARAASATALSMSAAARTASAATSSGSAGRKTASPIAAPAPAVAKAGTAVVVAVAHSASATASSASAKPHSAASSVAH